MCVWVGGGGGGGEGEGGVCVGGSGMCEAVWGVGMCEGVWGVYACVCTHAEHVVCVYDSACVHTVYANVYCI